MSIVIVQPDMLATAWAELNSINGAMRAGNAAAEIPTTGVVPAAADVVSILIAAQFASHARLYQAVSAHAVSVQDQFATGLITSAGSYAVTEAANAMTVG